MLAESGEAEMSMHLKHENFFFKRKHLSLRVLVQSKWFKSQSVFPDSVSTNLGNTDITVKERTLSGCQLLNQGLTSLESVKLCNYLCVAVLMV